VYYVLEKESFTTYLQKKDYDCGAGAAGIVLLNFGVPKVRHDRLMSSLEVKRSGTTPENLVRFFRRRGFDVFSKEETTISELKKELEMDRLPIVLYQGSGTKEELSNLEGGHYSVVAGVGKKYIYLLDPGVDEDYGEGVGWYKLSLSTFDRRWRDKWNVRGKEVYSVRWMLSVGLKKVRR
jgi:predicted double-glycine peptidase